MARRPKRLPRLDHKPLLVDIRVRTWNQAIGLRSQLTAQVLLRQLGLFLHEVNLTPEGLVDKARLDPDGLAELLVSYAARLKRRDRLDSYIAKTFTGVKSWLRFRRAEFNQFPRLRVIPGQSIRDETPPTTEQLARLLSVLSARGRVVALLMAHSGVRPGVLASHDGRSGLRLGDLPELRVANGDPTIDRIPFVVRVPAELSKIRREYVTFGSREEATAVLAYLTERARSGERLGRDSPLVAVDPSKRGAPFRLRAGTRLAFVTTKAITYDLREAIRSVRPEGTSWRPYVLRSYCSLRLLSAEGHGLITRDVREAILGHDLGVAGRYNLAKRLHPDTVEEMRGAYSRAAPFLETSGSPERAQAIEQNVLRRMLRLVGVQAEELDRVDLTKMDEDELADWVSQRTRHTHSAPKHPDERRGSMAQRVVPLGQVESLLAEGYEYIAPLGGDRAILKTPN